MKTLLGISILGAALACGPALAQSAQPADRNAPAATTTNASSKLMLKGNWRASKLMGLDVYNDNNEKLGDVNEIILDKNGKVTAVVIGVGGFLGMGEHDVAVPMEKLKFMEEPVRAAANTTTTTRDTTATRDTTTGAATAPATAPANSTTARTNAANDWVPDHAVMSATKEQLKALPQFKYSDYN